MLTEQEKQIAKALIDNEEYKKLLTKVMLTDDLDLTLEEVNSKDDKELGELLRADIRANDKVKRRFAILQRAAQEKQGKPNPAAKK